MYSVGWPQSKKNFPPDLKEFWNHKLKLSENQGIIFKDQRILVPLVLRSKIHQDHQGIKKSKQRARQTVFLATYQ